MDTNFRKELTEVINKHGVDTECGAPDFIVAHYVCSFLKTYSEVGVMVDAWKKKRSMPAKMCSCTIGMRGDGNMCETCEAQRTLEEIEGN